MRVPLALSVQWLFTSAGSLETISHYLLISKEAWWFAVFMFFCFPLLFMWGSSFAFSHCFVLGSYSLKYARQGGDCRGYHCASLLPGKLTHHIRRPYGFYPDSCKPGKWWRVKHSELLFLPYYSSFSVAQLWNNHKCPVKAISTAFMQMKAFRMSVCRYKTLKLRSNSMQLCS